MTAYSMSSSHSGLLSDPSRHRNAIALPDFTHGPLAASEIRLLVYAPDSTYDSVRLLVNTFARAEAPQYTALSYEWGEPDSQHEISIDGKPFSIRQNLLNALQSLQSHISDFFWVDALCIDQSNKIERNHQVKSMGMIYSEARLVVAWLGSYDESLRGLFRPETRDSWATLINGCESVLGKSYWNRLWIWQELALAKNVLILCGSNALPFVRLRDHVRGNVAAWTDIAYGACNVVSNGGTLSLLEALDTFGSRLCSEPRDRVFALLNIVQPVERDVLSQIFPDYTLSMESVVLLTLVHLRRYLKPGQYTVANNSARILTALGGRDRVALRDLQKDLVDEERQLRNLGLESYSVADCALRRRLPNPSLPADRENISKKRIVVGLGVREIDIFECLFATSLRGQITGFWASDHPNFVEPPKIDRKCNAPTRRYPGALENWS